MRFLTLDTLQCYGFAKRVDGSGRIALTERMLTEKALSRIGRSRRKPQSADFFLHLVFLRFLVYNVPVRFFRS